MSLMKKYNEFTESLSEKSNNVQEVVEFTAFNNMGRPHWRKLYNDGATFNDIDIARKFITDNRRKFMKNIKLRIGEKEFQL